MESVIINKQKLFFFKLIQLKNILKNTSVVLLLPTHKQNVMNLSKKLSNLI